MLWERISSSDRKGDTLADKGGSSILPIVLIGGAAYLGYKIFLSPATTAAQASGTPQGSPTPAGAGTAGVQPGAAAAALSTAAPAQSPYNSLDATFGRLTAQVQSNAAGDPAITQLQGTYQATPSVFNYYLGQVSSYALDAPGMASAFPAGDKPMSLGAFWSAASQYLAQSKGLSGIGGGRGLAGYILSRRRA